MTEKETAVIRIYESSKNRIAAHGSFGDSFADVVERILEEYDEYKLREKKENPSTAFDLALAY
jgi:hypothetical protein